jgi:anti-sigma regulatory factor (Ser/Thr protein kinase)
VPEARIELPAEPASASAARQFLRSTLEAWGCEDLTDSGSLLVSELVTNAVLHARSPIELIVGHEHQVVRVEVVDRDDHLPVRKHYAIDAGTGRGMVLVESIADRWGAEIRSQGKAVWFELDQAAKVAP